MKQFLVLIALTISVGAFAQERVVLDSSDVRVNSSSAILVRTAQTPDKVEVTFQVPMANSFCADSRTEYIPRTCFRNENVYQTRQVCEDVVVSTPAPSTTNPRGPRYNPTPQTRRVCENRTVLVGTRQVRYDCSYHRNYCARYATDVTTEADKVKIKFKLSALAGSEEETFVVTAKQRTYDGANVEYDIQPSNENQVVKKKGILGYDSYVIEEN